MVLMPALALAADTPHSAFDFGSWRWWVLLAFVQFVTLVGWGAANLPQLAGWTDGLAKRLEILQGVLTGLMAGNAVYFLAAWWGIADIPCMVFAGVGGWGGQKTLDKTLERLFGVLDAIIGKEKP